MGYSGVLLFNLHQPAIKPLAPEQKTSCQNNGGQLRKGGQAFTVIVWGEHRPFYKDAGQGRGGGVERVGRREEKDKWSGCPPHSLLSASAADSSPLGRNGIFPFQMSA